MYKKEKYEKVHFIEKIYIFIKYVCFITYTVLCNVTILRLRKQLKKSKITSSKYQ